jgi:hypothetical protein
MIIHTHSLTNAPDTHTHTHTHTHSEQHTRQCGEVDASKVLEGFCVILVEVALQLQGSARACHGESVYVRAERERKRKKEKERERRERKRE